MAAVQITLFFKLSEIVLHRLFNEICLVCIMFKIISTTEAYEFALSTNALHLLSFCNRFNDLHLDTVLPVIIDNKCHNSHYPGMECHL